MAKKEYTIDSLKEIVYNINIKYFLNDLWDIREEFYNIPENQLREEYLLMGLILIKVMEGNIQEAKRLTDSLLDGSAVGEYQYHLLNIILPTNKLKQLKEHILYFSERDLNLPNLSVTSGRPSLINGIIDVSRFSPLLERRRHTFHKILKILYGSPAETILNITIAEYKYQINNCIEAMVFLAKQIPQIEHDGDMRVLFVALCLQMKILIVNGEIDSVSKLGNEIEKRVSKNGSTELAYNLDALNIKFALLEGNYPVIKEWLKRRSPDEYGDFNMLDLYRYLIKIRCLILEGKYMAVIALSERLRPMLKMGYRHMDICELDTLLAIGGYKAGLMEESYAALERALTSAKKYKYLRVLGDEGESILKVLNAYKRTHPDSEFIPFINTIIPIARKTGVLYPKYLTRPFTEKVELTLHEKNILNQLSEGLTYEEIALETNISINTVRYHIKKIYERLQVNSSSEAITRAKELELL